MSKKKPAKPMAGQSKQPVQDPAVYGVLTRYLGVLGAHAICGTCGKKTVRGMIRVKGSDFYCSSGCASSSK